MKIAICSDHAGVEYKTKLISYLLGKGYEVLNFGTDSTESMDYPDVAHPMAAAIAGPAIAEARPAASVPLFMIIRSTYRLLL